MKRTRLIPIILLLIGYIALLISCGQPEATESTPTPAIAGFVGGTDFRPGVYSGYDSNDANSVLKGNHAVVSWAQLEPTDNNYTFSVIDNIITNLPAGKDLVLRVVFKGNNQDGDEVYTPSWLLNDTYDALRAECDGAPTRILNFTNDSVKVKMGELIAALGAAYDSEPKITMVEIAPGHNGEASPYPLTNVSCGRASEPAVYNAKYSPGEWADYHTWLNAEYAANFPTQNLTTIVTGTTDEGQRYRVVQDAVGRGIGLFLSSLTEDYYSNRGKIGDACYWYQFANPSATLSQLKSAYNTEWITLLDNWESVPIGFEFSQIVTEQGYVWNAIFNALDKFADYVMPYQEQMQYSAALQYFSLYAGTTATTTPAVWARLRSSNSSFSSVQCPDFYDYTHFLTPEWETIGMYNTARLSATNNYNETTRAYYTGSPPIMGSERTSRQTNFPYYDFLFDVDDDYAYATNLPSQILVIYFDGGTDSFKVKYGSGAGTQSRTINLTNTNQWKVDTWNFTPTGGFNNSLNKTLYYADDGYDVGIYNEDAYPNKISYIQVQVFDPARPTPTPVPISPTPALTATPTAGFGPTATPTWTPNPSITPGLTPLPTTVATSVPTNTPLPTVTASTTATASPTKTATATPWNTLTPIPTGTPTQTPIPGSVLFNELIRNADPLRWGDDAFFELYSSEPITYTGYVISVENISDGTRITNTLPFMFTPTQVLVISHRELERRCECSFDVDNTSVYLYDPVGTLLDSMIMVVDGLQRIPDGGFWELHPSAAWYSPGSLNRKPTPTAVPTTPRPTLTPTATATFTPTP